MKRSQINEIIRTMRGLLEEYRFSLPPFADWTPEEWAEKGHEYDEIRENMLGWDVTDFGTEDFEHVGLTLFTVRNGNANMPEKYAKKYAEKIMMVSGKQVTPYHYHANKMEDIINRGEGTLCITLYNSTADNQFADTDVHVYTDGCHRVVPAGTTVELNRGESITLMPGVFHTFCGKDDRLLLVGEVSLVNDDNNDNVFYQPCARFAPMVEDEAPAYLLVNDYPAAR